MKKIILASVMLLSSASAVAGVSAETAQELATFVQEFVMDQITDEFGDEVHAQITVPNLEKRQRLDECDGELEAELVKKDLKRLSNSVKLVCTGDEKNWNAVVPVRIKFTEPAVTIKGDLDKDQPLTLNNLEVSYVDRNNLKGNYFTDPNDVVGSKLKRSLRSGSVLKTSHICMVCKDDIVDLEAGTGEVTIKVQGKALQDGSLNANVKVTNLISNKQVIGRVVGVKHVRIDVK